MNNGYIIGNMRTLLATGSCWLAGFFYLAQCFYQLIALVVPILHEIIKAVKPNQ